MSAATPESAGTWNAEYLYGWQPWHAEGNAVDPPTSTPPLVRAKPPAAAALHALRERFSAEVNGLVTQRAACRRARCWREADGIRDRLRAEFGVDVHDHGEASTWDVGSPLTCMDWREQHGDTSFAV